MPNLPLLPLPIPLPLLDPGFAAAPDWFAEEAANLVATVRNKPGELAAKLDHPNLHVAILDINDEAQAVNVAAEAVEKFSSIDVLVNNAGFGLLGGVEEISDAEARRVYETNVFGLLKVTRAVLPHMRRQRSGHVVNFSSVGGLTGSAGWGSTPCSSPAV